jgi:heme-binding protein
MSAQPRRDVAPGERGERPTTTPKVTEGTVRGSVAEIVLLPSTMKRARPVFVALVVVFALMQIPRCARTNPPVTGEIDAPADVEKVLHRACYDCHSNLTRWPWYARVAPVSWLLYRDVTEGRRHLNFTEWDKVPADKRARRIAGCGREVTSGDMPPWFYLPLHPAAKLSDADKALVEKWASDAGGAGTAPGYRANPGM